LTAGIHAARHRGDGLNNPIGRRRIIFSMKMWIQIAGQNEDDAYPDGAIYELLTGGVLKVSSGNDIHLYSPAHWQEVTIDTRPAGEQDERAQPLDEDLRWQ
jgi:hypothetical protein